MSAKPSKLSLRSFFQVLNSRWFCARMRGSILLPDVPCPPNVGKREFLGTYEVFGALKPRFAQLALIFLKLKGNRSLMLASLSRCGNSVSTWRSQAKGSTPQARQVSIRL
jgi:hypothetical protein